MTSNAVAKAFHPELVALKKIGWSWLDESYLTDYRYDSAYGTLYPRLEAMRADLPSLDFVYLDVYYGRGRLRPGRASTPIKKCCFPTPARS